MSDLLDQQNNGFGPIPKKRGNKPKIFASIILVLFVIICLVHEKIRGEKESHKEWSFNLWVLLVAMSRVYLGEHLRRLFLLFEECGHIQTRHRGSKQEVLRVSFLQPNGSMRLTILFVGISFWITYEDMYKVGFNGQYIEIFIFSTIFVPLFSFITGLSSPPCSEISEKIESESKNVADGLAWSYYFGYLKIILPHLEENIRKTTQEVDGKKLCDYIQNKKVFIVIPRDCYCDSKFDNVDNRIKFIGNTHSHLADRAGVQSRVYKNSVYEIKPSSDKVYHCLMEYAPPLMSLHEMANRQNPGLDVSWKEEQVVLFFKKLKEILESDPECRGKYHIVLTSDARNDLADTMEREILAARNATSVSA